MRAPLAAGLLAAAALAHAAPPTPADIATQYTTDADRSGYLLVTRNNARQYRLPAEPVLAPDREYIVTADFCASDCDNEVALWRVTPDGVRKERVLRPATPWRDASTEWSVDDSIVLDYRRAGAAQRERTKIALSDPRWRPAR